MYVGKAPRFSLRRFFALFTLIALFATTATFARTVTASGGCSYDPLDPNATQEWVRTEVWYDCPVGADPGCQPELWCSMGVTCNGRAYNTCGGIMPPGGGTPEARLAQLYGDAATADSSRLANNGQLNHITTFAKGTGALTIATNVAATYKIFSLNSGIEMWASTGGLIPANQTTYPSTTSLTTGVYMIVAYDSAGLIVGYKTFSI
jgi:hypothetical protein